MDRDDAAEGHDAVARSVRDRQPQGREGREVTTRAGDVHCCGSARFASRRLTTSCRNINRRTPPDDRVALLRGRIPTAALLLRRLASTIGASLTRNVGVERRLQRFVARSRKAGKSALDEIEKFVKQKNLEARAAGRRRSRKQRRGSSADSSCWFCSSAAVRRSARRPSTKSTRRVRTLCRTCAERASSACRLTSTPIPREARADLDANVEGEGHCEFVFGLEQARRSDAWWSPTVDISTKARS